MRFDDVRVYEFTWLDRTAEEEPAGLSPRNGRVEALDEVRPLDMKSSGLLMMWGIDSIPKLKA